MEYSKFQNLKSNGVAKQNKQRKSKGSHESHLPK